MKQKRDLDCGGILSIFVTEGCQVYFYQILGYDNWIGLWKFYQIQLKTNCLLDLFRDKIIMKIFNYVQHKTQLNLYFLLSHL